MLAALTWPGAVIAILIVFVIRPVTGWIGPLGRELPRYEKFSIAFFGIRGIGSIYYLTYALNEGDFETEVAAQLWAVVAFTILISVAVHGVTASPILKRITKGERISESTDPDVAHPEDIGLADPNNR